MKIKKILITTVLTCLCTVSSAFVTVGSTVDCDYDNLLDAYNDTDAFVRVTTEVTHSDSFTISKSQWFTGGYSTCAFAVADIQGGAYSKWTHSGFGTVISINAANAIVTLDQFEIFGGNDVSSSGAGGIKVVGNAALLLANSLVHDNAGNEGGGIRLWGPDARVTITDSRIYNNTSSAAGAGVYCENGARFTMLADSAIKTNIATGKGGGIYANSDCQVNVLSGTADNSMLLEIGIIGNQASQGGGVYITNGADMTLTGNDEHPASIVANISNVNSFVGGGGVYVNGVGSSFTGTNAKIDFNQAQDLAAGIVVFNSAEFSMTRLDTTCWDNDKCSSFSNNSVNTASGDSGGGYIGNDSTVEIFKTYIANNRADGTVLFTLYINASLKLEGNLIVDNTSFAQNSAAQLFNIAGPSGSPASLNFFYNTIASNNTLSHFRLNSSTPQTLRIYNSIIRDQGDIINTSAGVNHTLIINCNYLHETSSLGFAQSEADNFNANPGFVDAANGDYHVVAGSLSKDLCSNDFTQSIYDLNGNLRGDDDPSVPNLNGPYDAGAYEYTENDTVFKNGFE